MASKEFRVYKKINNGTGEVACIYEPNGVMKLNGKDVRSWKRWLFDTDAMGWVFHGVSYVNVNATRNEIVNSFDDCH